MDPIQSIEVSKDSSLAMLIEAQKRKYEIYYMEIKDLYLKKDGAYAQAKIIKIKNNIKNWYSFKKNINIKLCNLNIILMRKNPPFNINFSYATNILDIAEKQGALVINKPQSLRDFNEKLFIHWFPNLIPNTLVTKNIALIKKFLIKNKKIIIKPLDGMGGESIFYINLNDPNTSVIIENMTQKGVRYCMSQCYIPDIKNGDKRVLIVHGKVIPYCVARIPQKGETRGNIAAGGITKIKKINEKEKQIAKQIAPLLLKKGLLFVGIDIIGDKLTEINITSPTCIKEIEKKTKISITKFFFDVIEKKIKNI